MKVQGLARKTCPDDKAARKRGSDWERSQPHAEEREQDDREPSFEERGLEHARSCGEAFSKQRRGRCQEHALDTGRETDGDKAARSEAKKRTDGWAAGVVGSDSKQGRGARETDRESAVRSKGEPRREEKKRGLDEVPSNSWRCWHANSC